MHYNIPQNRDKTCSTACPCNKATQRQGGTKRNLVVSVSNPAKWKVLQLLLSVYNLIKKSENKTRDSTQLEERQSQGHMTSSNTLSGCASSTNQPRVMGKSSRQMKEIFDFTTHNSYVVIPLTASPKCKLFLFFPYRPSPWQVSDKPSFSYCQVLLQPWKHRDN